MDHQILNQGSYRHTSVLALHRIFKIFSLTTRQNHILQGPQFLSYI